MESIVCTNQGLWENKQNSSFLQSYEWGEFQKRFGKEVLRIHVEGGEEIRAGVQGIVQKLPFGLTYLYVPRPDISSVAEYTSFLEYLLRHHQFVFVRFEPRSFAPEFGKNFPKAKTWPRLWQHTLVLHLRDSEDQILSQMHSKTRYNIGLAQRKGVEVKEIEDINIFWKLNEETGVRDQIRTHDKSYYQEMLQEENIRLFCAFFNGFPLCAGIFSFYNKRCTYIHGASGNRYRNFMAPYLLQWEVIQRAKNEGYEEYDFGGIAAPVQKNQPSTQFHMLDWNMEDKLTGVTRFKAGFGGERESYGDTFDVVLKPFFYKLYNFVKKFR